MECLALGYDLVKGQVIYFMHGACLGEQKNLSRQSFVQFLCNVYYHSFENLFFKGVDDS